MHMTVSISPSRVPGSWEQLIKYESSSKRKIRRKKRGNLFVSLVSSVLEKLTIVIKILLITAIFIEHLPRCGKESSCQSRKYKRLGFHPWVGKIPWRRKWQPTPVFLPGESHGQRSLAGYTPWGHTESQT